MCSETLYLFLDARTFIDYSLFTDIRWNDEFVHSDIVLMICHPVIRELYRIKNDPGDIRIRKRADTLIKTIYYLVKNNPVATINDHTRLTLLLDDLQIDRTKCVLKAEGPYHRLLASVLCFSQKNKILVTSDPDLIAAAVPENIPCVSLPEKYLLVQKKPQMQTEITTLQKRRRSLQKETPNLNLNIISDSGVKPAAAFAIKIIPEFSDKAVQKDIEALRNTLAYNTVTGAVPESGAADRPAEAEIKRYHDKLNHYLTEMAVYYKDLWKHNGLISRMVTLKFILANTGSGPVDDIRLFLHFPDGFILTDNPAHFKQPAEPVRPDPPRSPKEMLNDILNFKPGEKHEHPEDVPVKTDTHQFIGPVIRMTHSYDVRFRVQRLQQGRKFELDTFYLLFRSYDAVKSFTAEYSISAANAPEPLRAEIPFVFRLT